MYYFLRVFYTIRGDKLHNIEATHSEESARLSLEMNPKLKRVRRALKTLIFPSDVTASEGGIFGKDYKGRFTLRWRSPSVMNSQEF